MNVPHCKMLTITNIHYISQTQDTEGTVIEKTEWINTEMANVNLNSQCCKLYILYSQAQACHQNWGVKLKTVKWFKI